LAGTEETRKWIVYELAGYVADDPIADEYMEYLGRYTDREKKLGYWGPLAEIDATLSTWQLRLQALRIPDVSYSISSANPNEFVTGFTPAGAETTAPVKAVLDEARSLSDAIQTFAGIRSKTLALLHSFAANVYHERVFSGLAESLFDKFKKTVDDLLTARSGDILERVPAVYDRLAEGSQEAISQALTTCRRIIRAFADAAFPPSDTPVQIDGEPAQVGPEQYLNRINAYIARHVQSDSRRMKLRQSLRNIHERTSAGVHNDVTSDEARALFLETYILLGEILTVTSPPPPVARLQRPAVAGDVAPSGEGAP